MDNITTIAVKQIPENISNIREFLNYEKLEIKSQDDYEAVGQHFLAVKKHLKMTEDERVKITGPINQSLRNINDLFKRISDPLNKVGVILTSKMRVWTDSQRKLLEEQERIKREEDKKRLEDEAKAKKLESIELDSDVALEAATSLQKRADSIDTQNVSVKQTVRLGQVGTVAERRVWKWRVVDENKIPRNFLMVNEKAINQLMKEIIAAGGQDMKLDGVEFYQETNFSALK